jgi:hypothetical protein
MKASKDIVVLETAISNEVIYQLQTNDFREDLNAVINEYARQLEEGGVEIFQIGNDFVVTEDCIYIAAYEEDVNEQ